MTVILPEKMPNSVIFSFRQNAGSDWISLTEFGKEFQQIWKTNDIFQILDYIYLVVFVNAEYSRADNSFSSDLPAVSSHFSCWWINDINDSVGDTFIMRYNHCKN